MHAWNYELSAPFSLQAASAMKIRETLRCRGHPNISGRHLTTFEVTREDQLSPQGDCIIGIGTDKGAAGLSPLFVKMLTHDDAVLITRLSCRDLTVTICSQGSSVMTLDHPTDLVWRRSSFVCGRTVGIRSDHAACDLPRDLIEFLRNGEEMIVDMTVIAE